VVSRVPEAMLIQSWSESVSEPEVSVLSPPMGPWTKKVFAWAPAPRMMFAPAVSV